MTASTSGGYGRGVNRSLRSVALFAAFLVPTALLAWIGLRTLTEQSERAAERYRDQALALIDAIEARVKRDLGDVGSGASKLGPLELRFAKDGTWLGEKFELASVVDSNARDPVLFAALRGDVDRLQSSGDVAAAIARLSDATKKDDDPPIAAWALESRAALLRQTNDSDGARADLEALVERHPTVRDAHGLRRAFAARFELARSSAPSSPSSSGAADRLALYGDLIDDYGSLDQTATAQLILEVREALAEDTLDATQRSRIDELDRQNSERERRRRWLASIPTGISNWIAQGAPGGAAEFELAKNPIGGWKDVDEHDREIESDGSLRSIFFGPDTDRIVVLAHRDGEEVIGRAIEPERLFRAQSQSSSTASELPTFGFGPKFEDVEHRQWDLEKRRLNTINALPEPAPFARRALSSPLDRYSIVVRGGDLDGFVASERRQLWWSAAIIAVALLAALGGAIATLRAISREIQAAEGREAFVAAVTHELKAPLAAIRLFAEVLERGDVEPNKVREFGSRTVHESDRLARLIDSVLELAKIEHSKNGALDESIELGELARRVIATFDSIARERGFTVELRAPSEIRVRGDRDALEGALFNLLDNALKYSDAPHAIEVEVARASSGFAELAVLDRGRGVATEDAKRIFEPFARVGDELTRDRPGVGLGLALVSKIAAAHGGRASVEARDGGGSRFAIEIPASST